MYYVLPDPFWGDRMCLTHLVSIAMPSIAALLGNYVKLCDISNCLHV